MKRYRMITLALLVLLCGAGLRAQSTGSTGAHEKVVFRFTPGNDGFYLHGNEAELQRLYSFIDANNSGIQSGKVPIFVTSYSSTLPTINENLNLAMVMANRVKSELITHKNLREEHFRTSNLAQAYETYPTAVVVEITTTGEAPVPGSAGEVPESGFDAAGKEDASLREEPRSHPDAEAPQPVEDRVEPETRTLPEERYVGIRTNLLHDALFTPSLGIEWRVNRNIGIKVDGSFAHWGSSTGNIQKVWLVNPEVRRYVGQARRMYVGLGAGMGEYNLYKGYGGMRMFTNDTGYQGKLYGGGVTVGYQLRLAAGWSVDFNLGLGYTRLEYDSFTLSNQTRVYRRTDETKNFWGPTQAGISLVWHLGK